jgi:ribosome-associated translation inhibitor RaiA
MSILLTANDAVITDQLRTYVQYRLFTSLARYQPIIRGINVTLGRQRGNRSGFLCVVAVDLGLGEQIKIRASGAHPNAAIDRAANRASVRLSRCVPQEVSPSIAICHFAIVTTLRTASC